MFFPEDLYIARMKTLENVDFHSLKQNQLKIYLELLQEAHLKLQEILFQVQEMPGILAWKFTPNTSITIRNLLWEIGILMKEATVKGIQKKQWTIPRQPRFISFEKLLDHLRQSYMDFLSQLMILDDDALSQEVMLPDGSKKSLSSLILYVIDSEIKIRGQIELIITLYDSLEH